MDIANKQFEESMLKTNALAGCGCSHHLTEYSLLYSKYEDNLSGPKLVSS